MNVPLAAVAGRIGRNHATVGLDRNARRKPHAKRAVDATTGIAAPPATIGINVETARPAKRTATVRHEKKTVTVRRVKRIAIAHHATRTVTVRRATKTGIGRLAMRTVTARRVTKTRIGLGKGAMPVADGMTARAGTIVVKRVVARVRADPRAKPAEKAVANRVMRARTVASKAKRGTPAHRARRAKAARSRAHRGVSVAAEVVRNVVSHEAASVTIAARVAKAVARVRSRRAAHL